MKTKPTNNQIQYYKKCRTKDNKVFEIKKMNRRLAISQYCSECICWSQLPGDCKKDCCEKGICTLYPFRMGVLPKRSTPSTRARAIKRFCKNCVGKDMDWLTNCPSILCPLHPYRLEELDTTSLLTKEDLERQ